MNNNCKRLLSAAAALALALGVTGCGSQKPAEAEAQQQILVESAHPQRGEVRLTTDFIGTVMPDESVNVFSKLAGEVTRTYFEVGDTVKKGDLLMEIDDTNVRMTVNSAKAAYDYASANIGQMGVQAETSYKTAHNGYKAAKDAYDDYYDNAEGMKKMLWDKVRAAEGAVQQANDKIEKLQAEYDALLAEKEAGGTEDGAGTEETSTPSAPTPSEDGAEDQSKPSIDDKIKAKKAELEKATLAANQAVLGYQQASKAYDDYRESLDKGYDQAEMAYENATIAYEAAKNSFENTMNSEVEGSVAAASLKQAQTGYQNALTQLSYAKVYSPIDGVVEMKNVTPHGMVSQTAPAYVVSDKDTMTVTFSVSADAVHHMEVGDLVQVENGSDRYDATVVEISSAVNPQSGLFPVKARIEGDVSKLLTGVAVKVSAVTQRAEDVLLLPLSNLYYEDNKPYIYTLDDENKAVQTWLTLGLADNENVEVLDGIDENTRIISTWHPSLMDGVQVTLRGEEAPAAEPETESRPVSSAPADESSEAPSRAE